MEMEPKAPYQSVQLADFDRVIARKIMWLLLGLGALVRLIYFLQLASGPSLYLHRWDQSDMHFFDHWARIIADGDWLSDRALHPVHHWTKDLAQRYLEKNPDDPAHQEPEPAIALWNRWYGEKQFHQGPLYPYLIAVVYSLVGADVRWCFVLQLLTRSDQLGSDLLGYLAFIWAICGFGGRCYQFIICADGVLRVGDVALLSHRACRLAVDLFDAASFCTGSAFVAALVSVGPCLGCGDSCQGGILVVCARRVCRCGHYAFVVVSDGWVWPVLV